MQFLTSLQTNGDWKRLLREEADLTIIERLMREGSHHLFTRWGVWRLLWRKKLSRLHLFRCQTIGTRTFECSIGYIIKSVCISLRPVDILILIQTTLCAVYIFQTRHQLLWKFRQTNAVFRELAKVCTRKYELNIFISISF